MREGARVVSADACPWTPSARSVECAIGGSAPRLAARGRERSAQAPADKRPRALRRSAAARRSCALEYSLRRILRFGHTRERLRARSTIAIAPNGGFGGATQASGLASAGVKCIRSLRAGYSSRGRTMRRCSGRVRTATTTVPHPPRPAADARPRRQRGPPAESGTFSRARAARALTADRGAAGCGMSPGGRASATAAAATTLAPPDLPYSDVAAALSGARALARSQRPIAISRAHSARFPFAPVRHVR